ncbi:MAG: phage antirepressor KilAC domain-containing protein [Bacteroidales bacterium]
MELIKITKSEGGKSIVDARELHAFLEVKSDFRNWIKNYIKDFHFTEYHDYVTFGKNLPSGGRSKEYAITTDMAKELSMLARSKKGKQARTYFIERDKLASRLTLIPDFNDPIAAARAWADSKEKEQLAINEKNIAEAKVLEMKPKVEFANSVSNSNDLILIGDLAKQLKSTGINIGRNRLFKWLRDNKYLCKNSNEPTQKSMDLGVFKVVERVMTTGDNSKILRTTKVAGKGQIYFTNKLKDERL